ncbi:ImmA/IrrE family metallo-endopeptidase [Lacrimispora sp.]|uniref:helix-turn-helix domain-containing protein n=1 Tax=Lacrimispora sp. TaxID=2719234 RepID=UPI0034602810
MIVNKEIIPYRINQARLSRGLSMSELADLVDVSKQAISQYETGKTKPTDGTLNQIAFVLRYSADFFRKPVPANSSMASGVFFRSKRTARQKDLKSAEMKIEILREIDDYLSQYIDFPEVNFPRVDYDYNGIEPIGNDIIENYAKQLREYWNLGYGPIDNLMNVVQRNGIVVSSTKLKLQKLDGLSEWYNNTPYIFMSRDKDTNCRIRFGIAHEIGHLLMHAGNIPPEDIVKDAVHKKLEDEANRFAGAFLLPKETFRYDVFKTSIDHFIQLKAKWKVSLSAMIYRCNALDLLTTNQLKYLNDQMTQRVYWHHEPLDNEMPIERPFAHKQAINLLLDNDIINPIDFVNAIGCLPEELENYCCLEKGTLTPKSSGQIVQLKMR